MDSWGQLNPTSPGKKSSNRVYQSVSDSIIVSYFTVFENHRKSLIQHCERSELRLHLDKSFFKMPKMVHFGENLKPKVCNQTVLSDRSLLIGQKIGGKCQNVTFFKVIFKQSGLRVKGQKLSLIDV